MSCQITQLSDVYQAKCKLCISLKEIEQVPDKGRYLEAGALLPHCKKNTNKLGIKYELAFQQGVKLMPT